MSEIQLIMDLMQNIYARIAQLGKSINSLKDSLESLNKTVSERITTLVDTIKSMTQSVEKEGEETQLIFREIGENSIREIKKLQENIGIKDMDELLEKLRKIVDISQDALRPETVDLLLHEVLQGIKSLKGSSIEGEESEDDLLDKVGASLSSGSENIGGSGTDEAEVPPSATPPAANPPPNSPPPGNPPPGNPPPGNPPPGNPPPGNPPPGNPPPGNPPPI